MVNQLQSWMCAIAPINIGLDVPSACTLVSDAHVVVESPGKRRLFN